MKSKLNRWASGLAASMMIVGSLAAGPTQTDKDKTSPSAIQQPAQPRNQERDVKTSVDHARGTVTAILVAKRQITIMVSVPADKPPVSTTIQLTDRARIRLLSSDKDTLISGSLGEIQEGMYVVASGKLPSASGEPFTATRVYAGQDSKALTKLLPEEKAASGAPFQPKTEDEDTSMTQSETPAMPAY